MAEDGERGEAPFSSNLIGTPEAQPVSWGSRVAGISQPSGTRAYSGAGRPPGRCRGRRGAGVPPRSPGRPLRRSCSRSLSPEDERGRLHAEAAEPAREGGEERLVPGLCPLRGSGRAWGVPGGPPAAVPGQSRGGPDSAPEVLGEGRLPCGDESVENRRVSEVRASKQQAECQEVTAEVLAGGLFSGGRGSAACLWLGVL